VRADRACKRPATDWGAALSMQRIKGGRDGVRTGAGTVKREGRSGTEWDVFVVETRGGAGGKLSRSSQVFLGLGEVIGSNL